MCRLGCKIAIFFFPKKSKKGGQKMSETRARRSAGRLILLGLQFFAHSQQNDQLVLGICAALYLQHRVICFGKERLDGMNIN
jgi:hypothetical protein